MHDASASGLAEARQALGGLRAGSGGSVIVLEGTAAGDAGHRDLLDLLVFLETPAEELRARFNAAQERRGVDDVEQAAIWKSHERYDIPASLQQRDHAHLILRESPV